MLPGCGFLRAVLVAMFRGQLENVAVGPSLQSFVSNIGVCSPCRSLAGVLATPEPEP